MLVMVTEYFPAWLARTLVSESDVFVAFNNELLVLKNHWYFNGAVPATTVKVALPPATFVRLTGWLVMAGGGLPAVILIVMLVVVLTVPAYDIVILNELVPTPVGVPKIES